MTRRLQMLMLLLVMLTSGYSYAQIEPDYTEEEEEQTKKEEKKFKPFRIGAKVGVPNLIGGNLEFVLPVLDNRLAVTADYSIINGKWFGLDEGEGGERIDMSFNYVGGGVNYYLFKPGSGFYIGAGYEALIFDGTLSDIDSEQYNGVSGSANINYTNDALYVKFGAKLGGGLVYFRPEIGYSFNPLPKEIDIDVHLSNGVEEHQTLEFNEQGNRTVDMLLSGIIFNIGIGFAF